MVFWSLCVLTGSRRLSCVFCRDPNECLSFVLVWSGRIGFWKGFLLSDGKWWLSDKRISHACRARSGPERVLAEAITVDGRREWDVQILFGVECVDKMALQPMLSQHPSFAVREV